VQEKNVAGLYDGPFPWENLFGFHLAGMVGHDFFKPYDIKVEEDTLRVEVRIDTSKYDGMEPLYTEYNVGHFAR
jgi:hypothetical protein